MKRPVISNSQLPVRLPITFTAMAWLLMDRLHASGTMHGVIWTLLAIVWAVVAFGLITQEQTDIFDPTGNLKKGKNLP